MPYYHLIYLDIETGDILGEVEKVATEDLGPYFKLVDLYNCNLLCIEIPKDLC